MSKQPATHVAPWTRFHKREQARVSGSVLLRKVKGEQPCRAFWDRSHRNVRFEMALRLIRFAAGKSYQLNQFR